MAYVPAIKQKTDGSGGGGGGASRIAPRLSLQRGRAFTRSSAINTIKSRVAVGSTPERSLPKGKNPLGGPPDQNIDMPGRNFSKGGSAPEAAPADTSQTEDANPITQPDYVNPGRGGGSEGGGGGGGQSAPSPEQSEEPSEQRGNSRIDSQPQEQQQESYEEQQSYDEELPDQEEEYESEIGTDPVIPIYASNVCNGRLRTFAFCNTKHGYVPVRTDIRAPRGSAPGPVDPFGNEVSETMKNALIQSKSIVMSKADVAKQKALIGKVVERSRQGDQNAMAIIAEVRNRRGKGDARADSAFMLIKEYIDENPVPQIGEEVIKPGISDKHLCWSIWLADGPSLTSDRINCYAGSFGNEEDKNVFLHGVVHYRKRGKLSELAAELDKQQQTLLDIGKTIGVARSIQMVRRPNSKISKFDAKIGWELGE